MPRWEPDIETRLSSAALRLFSSRGYDNTTIGDIADHVGVTSRTYFRYFPDKRGVLFGGEDVLRDRIAAALRDAPDDLEPLAAALHAMRSCSDLFHPREHRRLRRREKVIDTSAELREREAHKLATIEQVVTHELSVRGSQQDEAHLVADLAVCIFKQASRLWMSDASLSFASLIDRAASQVGDVMGHSGVPQSGST